MISCKNCGENVKENFCSQCGQKSTVRRISLVGLLKDLPHAIFHVDRGFLYNIKQLMRRPGPAIKGYLEGKRVPFYHPASFLIIALVVNYLVVKITDLHFYDQEELKNLDPLAAQAILDYDSMQWWFLEHTYIYILLAIPVSSLFLFAIFKMLKQSYNLAETAAVVLFTIAQGVLIQSFIYICFGWVQSGPFLRIVESVNLSILILYASLVIYQLITPGKKWTYLIIALLAGLGLAVAWIASAYVLYLLMT